MSDTVDVVALKPLNYKGKSYDRPPKDSAARAKHYTFEMPTSSAAALAAHGQVCPAYRKDCAALRQYSLGHLRPYWEDGAEIAPSATATKSSSVLDRAIGALGGTKSDMADMLEELGLATDGLKADLAERLEQWVQDHQGQERQG